MNVKQGKEYDYCVTLWPLGVVCYRVHVGASVCVRARMRHTCECKFTSPSAFTTYYPNLVF